MRTALPLILALLAGCQGTGGTSFDGVPKDRDLLGDFDWNSIAWEDALAAQLQLDEARAKLAREAAENEAHIADEQAREAMYRRIAYALAGFGALGVAGGVAVFIFVGRRMGIVLVIVGISLVIVSLAVGPLQSALSWAIPTALASALVAGGFMAAQKLWIYWQTNKQATRLEAEARHDLSNGGDKGGAALKLQSAKLLRHIASKNYDPTKTEPSAEALAALTGTKP